jgi:nitrous oxide reductase accessory protein NosL
MLLLAVCCFSGSAALAEDDVKAIPSCESCGMNRDRFGSSRMLIEFTDGSKAGTCSIRCAVELLCESTGKSVASIKVADYNSRDLIEADKAFWVVGGDRPGVMTRTPKWAFAREADAKAFIQKHGGEMATYAAAKKAAETELSTMGKKDSKGKKEKVGCDCCNKK